MSTRGDFPTIGVGVGVIVTKKGNVLFGKRKGAHDEGSWCYPGGLLEWGESFEDCARREVMEETGLTIKNLRVATVTNDFFEKDKKHYVTPCIVAEWESGDVQLREPEKIEKWEWFSWDNLPEPLFVPVAHVVAQGLNPFEQVNYHSFFRTF